MEDVLAQPYGGIRNHMAGIGAMDFLVVPTINFRLLFVLVILRHERRRLISLSVTDHPTAAWIARQITEAFPWDEALPHHRRPRRLLRPCRQAASCCHGHPGSPDCAAVTPVRTENAIRAGMRSEIG